MTAAGDALLTIAPAILFLLAAVPFARMLGDLGFFDAVVSWLARDGRSVSVAAFWVLAAATTAVLNLDTTVVLLTPLAIRLARRSGVDPLPLAAVPLLLAGLASSFLPVSNLTTLIVVERFDVGALDVLTALGPPSLAAVVVGWLVHRRRLPARLRVAAVDPAAGERGALSIGGAALGFLAPDGIGSDRFWQPGDVVGRIGVLLASVVAANVVNNVPATLLATAPDALMTDGRWLWLLGVNAGSLLLPTGTLAALLWWRLVAAEDVGIDLRRYLRLVVPAVVPALVAATAIALLTVPT